MIDIAYRNQIEIRYKDPATMPHLGKDAVHYAYAAMWTLGAFKGRLLTIKGCPAGTGSTEDKAIADLIKRTNAESGTNLALAPKEWE